MITDLVSEQELREYIEKSEILTEDAEILRKEGRPVTAENHEEAVLCMKKLFGALAADTNALGVAAQQVGHDLNIFVAIIKGEPQLFINPSCEKMKPTKYTKEYHEGCLSVPNKQYRVRRCSLIKARWQDAFKKWHQARLKEGDAVVFQHELDHVRGILICDKGREVKDLNHPVSL